MWRIVIIIGVLSAAPSQTLDAAPCLQYETVSLTGTAVRQTYPGPPDYESISKGDEPRVIWVLLLEHGVCAVDPDPRYPREYYEREVQLVMQREQVEQYKSLLGKKVTVTGRLMHGGAKYDKRLALEVDELSRTRR